MKKFSLTAGLTGLFTCWASAAVAMAADAGAMS